MTDDRYSWWCGEISKARADGDTKRLYTLQLDYNLELGACLAHQSQRTKDIRDESSGVKADLARLNASVDDNSTSLRDLNTAIAKTSENVSEMTSSVRELIEYRDGLKLRSEGAAIAGRIVRSTICGAAVVIGWAYAVYLAWLSFFGK